MPLSNHSALGFMGFRGEWPFAEAYEQADYTGFAGLECAKLVLTTAAPAPAGRLSFSVEAAPASDSGSIISGGSGAAVARSSRRLAMQPLDGSTGRVAPATDSASCGASSSSALALRLRLPANQRLSSVIWKDCLNRTVHVQTAIDFEAARSAAASSGATHYTTAAVALPHLYPFAESSADPAVGCTGAACEQLQRRYSVLLLSPDGRHSRADVTVAPSKLNGQRVLVRLLHYEQHQLTFEDQDFTLPASAASTAAGVTLYDAAVPGQALPLGRSGLVAPAASLPSSACGQWSLTLQLNISPAALSVALRHPGGHTIVSVDGGFPALTLGPSELSSSAAALWLHWGPAHKRRLPLPAWTAGSMHVVLVR